MQLPPLSKLYLAAALDYNSELPVGFNQATGILWSAFHFSQNIPVTVYPQIQSLDQTNSTAILYLTVEPTEWPVKDNDLHLLVEQCARLNMRGRRILLRFAPEMNAPWNIWGQKPSIFVRQWQTLHTMLRLNPRASNTSMIWSPIDGSDWPYRAGSDNISPSDFKLMDTNNDNRLDKSDDPFAPFYPGDQYTEWVGIVFHRGSASWTDNTLPEPGYVSAVISNTIGNPRYNFYDTYAVKAKKPLAITSSGAAYYTAQGNTPGGTSRRADIKRLWLQQFLFNASFLASYPELRMITLNEQVYIQNRLKVDFRSITVDDELLDFWNQQFPIVRDSFALASPANITSWTSLPPINNNGSWPQGLIGYTLLVVIVVPVLVVIFWIGITVYRNKNRRPDSPPDIPFNPEDKYSNSEVEDISTIIEDDSQSSHSRSSWINDENVNRAPSVVLLQNGETLARTDDMSLNVHGMQIEQHPTQLGSAGASPSGQSEEKIQVCN